MAPMTSSNPLRPLARALPLVEGDLRVSYALAQKFFTPRDVSQTQPILDDEPYAGYLYVGIGIESEQRRDGGRSILEDRKSTRLNSSHSRASRMPSSA